MDVTGWSVPPPRPNLAYADWHTLPGGQTGLVAAEIPGFDTGASVSKFVGPNVRELLTQGAAPESIWKLLNRQFPSDGSSGYFTSLTIAVFEPKNRTIRYVNGGGEQLILRRAPGATDELEVNAPALGIISNADLPGEIETAELAVDAGDVLVFQAGLIGLYGPNRNELDVDRLAATVRRATSDQPNVGTVADAVRQDCEEFVDGDWRGQHAAILVATV